MTRRWTLGLAAGIAAVIGLAMLESLADEAHEHGAMTGTGAPRHGMMDKAGMTKMVMDAKGTCPGKAAHDQARAAVEAAVDEAIKAVQAGDKPTAVAALNKVRSLFAADHAGMEACLGCGGKKEPTFANVRCPIMKGEIKPAEVVPELTRQWKGETVAFCCAGCPPVWDKLTDAEKDAKLKAVRPPAEPAPEPAESGHHH